MLSCCRMWISSISLKPVWRHRNHGCRKKQTEDWKRKIFILGLCSTNIPYRANIKIQRAFRNPAKTAVIPPKCSNHPKECKRGKGKGGAVGNTPLLPRTKMLLVPLIFFSGGYIVFWVLRFGWVNVIFVACFILRGHDTHIDFLRLLFLVGMICPLTRERFFDLFWNVNLYPLRLNKSSRLFNLLQSVSWIWIAKSDILLSVNVMVSLSRWAQLV